MEFPEEDDQLADDEEEILVYVEFDGSVASNTFSNEKLTLEMIGLDKEHPIMQVNGKYYEGTYHDVVGTYMFFEHDDNPPVDDPVFDAVPTLKYCAKTRKILKMHRIFVEPKTEMLGDSNDPNCVPNKTTVAEAGIPPRYQEAALKSWENMRNDRMEALNKYLEKQRIREEKRSQGIEPDSESDHDNPFAMYLPDSKRNSRKEAVVGTKTISEEKRSSSVDRIVDEDESIPRGESQSTMVIDPEPSTSKDSQPWSSPFAENDSNEFVSGSDSKVQRRNIQNASGKNRATVKVMRRGRTRMPTKSTNPKPRRGMQTQISSESDEDYIDDPPRLSEEVDNEMNSDTIDKIPDVENATWESPSKTVGPPGFRALSIEEETDIASDKRKIEKQQKRDEKMRLVAERLKRAAEEARLKTHRRSDIVSDKTQPT